MPRCLPILTPFLDRFFIDFYFQLRSPEPSKSLFFLRKNNVFSQNRFSKLALIFVRFLCQHASIFPPKIHQNPPKNRFQDASLFRSIFAWIFRRTRGRQDRQDGPKRPPRRPKRPPRRPQEGPEKPRGTLIFWYWPPRASEDPPGTLQD